MIRCVKLLSVIRTERSTRPCSHHGECYLLLSSYLARDKETLASVAKAWACTLPSILQPQLCHSPHNHDVTSQVSHSQHLSIKFTRIPHKLHNIFPLGVFTSGNNFNDHRYQRDFVRSIKVYPLFKKEISSLSLLSLKGFLLTPALFLFSSVSTMLLQITKLGGLEG